MNLGAFSLSLTVKDIAVSNTFYQKLGFAQIGGDLEQGWLILKNSSCVIGLFQGMFDRNIMTFNPGWDAGGKPVDNFTDIRDIQKTLKQAGVSFSAEADETNAGPASFMITDPDGNTILVDQHV